jgi:hypothetical protein
VAKSDPKPVACKGYEIRIVSVSREAFSMITISPSVPCDSTIPRRCGGRQVRNLFHDKKYNSTTEAQRAQRENKTKNTSPQRHEDTRRGRTTKKNYGLFFLLFVPLCLRG